MFVLSFLLLFVPGIIAWKIAGYKEPDTGVEMLKVLGLCSVFALFTALISYGLTYIKSGVKAIYLTNIIPEEGYSICVNSFVVKYGLLAIIVAGCMGIVVRLIRKWILKNEK